MADSTTTTVAASVARNNPPRGGRRHGPPGSDSNSQRDGTNRGGFQRGSRGPRGGRGRGRGSSNATTPGAGDLSSQPETRERPDSPSGGNFGARLTKAASQIQGDLGVQKEEPQEKAATTEEAEREICFICASTIEHTSIAPCNHQTCHICALRLRALYKTKACAHCRTEADFVAFTDNSEKRFQDFTDQDFVKADDNLGIKFENDNILDDTILLLRYNCPDKDCDVQCLSWPDLHRHVKSKHQKVMCGLCTRNKKVFTHEHELFSTSDLKRHERFGDDNPGAIDQSGFKGHPECGFCKERFYGDDELYNHCRERHERCHICDRRNQGRHPQYYLNYQELEKHFAEAHFVCLDAECQANKTNVFESEMDLKAHQLSEHPNGLSKDARRDARLVNLSGFDIRTPYQPERRGGREHRGGGGRGRGRNPDADPLPVSSAQPIGRAELAYQRQIAILNAPTSSARPFGGQLTQTAAPSRPQSQPQPRQPASTPAPPNLDTLTISDSQPATLQALTPQNEARAARHAAVLSRATSLLGPSSTLQNKMTDFRNLISSYRTSSITARDMVDQFATTIFPSTTPSAELGKLVRELADLYEADAKRQGLLEAWNSWRSINDESDYPTLPVPAGSSSSSISGFGTGRRVLRLKSSTAQSSRSAVSRQGSWGNALSPSNSNVPTPSNPFPSLPSSGASGKNATSAAWGASSSSSSRANHNQTSTLSSTRLNNARNPTTMGPRANDEMFPSLPATKKPDTLMAGLTRGTVRWDDRRPGSGTSTPKPSAWGSGAAPTPAQASAALNNAANGNSMDTGVLSDDAGAGVGSGKKQGKKGKGQVLYHFG